MTVRGRLKAWIVGILGAWPEVHFLKMALACIGWWALQRLLKSS